MDQGSELKGLLGSLGRNDVGKAVRVAELLSEAGKLDGQALNYLYRLQDDPGELDAQLSSALPQLDHH